MISNKQPQLKSAFTITNILFEIIEIEIYDYRTLIHSKIELILKHMNFYIHNKYTKVFIVECYY